MQDKIDALNKHIVEVKKEFEAYVKDSSIPIEERWNLFVSAPDELSETSGWIQHFKVENFNEDHFYQYVERHQRFSATDVIESVVEDMTYDNILTSEQIEEVSNGLKEHFLSQNLKSFQFDW